MSRASELASGPPRRRLADIFWERHANPWSGWSRVAVSPALMYALYRRDRRLFAAAVAFTALNPVRFSRPGRTDNWMSGGVLAEREWIAAGDGTTGTDYPNVLNLLGEPVWLYAVAAAVRRRPVGTVLATATAMALKLLWIDEIRRRTTAADESRRE